MHPPRCCRSATSWVHYTTSCNAQCSAPEDGQNNFPKHVELTGVTNKLLLLHQVGCLYYLYQRCTVKQISDNEIYLLIKYIKSVLWRVAKCLSYIQDARCLKLMRYEYAILLEWQGKTEVLREKTCPIGNSFTTDPTWTGLGAKPVLLDEWLGTNHLCHGMILNWDLCSGKLVIDHVSYGMAFSTRRVPFYSSASHSLAHSLWASGIIWKWVHFIGLYYQRLDLTNKFAVCLSYVGLFIICVHCPTVHQRCVRTHNYLSLRSSFM